MSGSDDRFFIAGGTLAPHAPSYVVRDADRELVASLEAGEFCYVLTPRQMGKSSLMVRTASTLRERGRTVAIIDLQRIGHNLSVEQWYAGLLDQVGRQLDVEDELEDFWLDHDEQPPLRRWLGALEWLLAREREKSIVIFLDEIDFVRSLPFRVDEFFSAIRGLYNRRASEPDFNRLSFCLLGVATPAELIVDVKTTPFNIGRRIELNDFTPAEATTFLPGLGHDTEAAEVVVGRVMYWTDGHPYLTQRLLNAVVTRAEEKSPKDVDRLCDELFLSDRSRERDDNLLFVRDRILRMEGDLANLLSLYGDILRERRVPDDPADEYKSLLKLSGIVAVRDGLMVVRNRIYKTVFPKQWVAENMPDAERRRQRLAFIRGAVIAGLAGLIGVSVLAGLSLYAWDARQQALAARQQAEHARQQAEQARQQAEQRLQHTISMFSSFTDHFEGLVDDPEVTVDVMRKFAELFDKIMDDPETARMLAGSEGRSELLTKSVRSLYRSLVRVRFRLGDIGIALARIDQRLASLEKAEPSTENRSEAGWYYLIKASLLTRQAKYGDAVASYDKGIAVLESLGDKLSPQDQSRLDSSYLARAEAYAETGNIALANRELKKRQAFYRKNYERVRDAGGDSAQTVATLFDYGRFLRRYADLLELSELDDAADAIYAEAVQVYADLRRAIDRSKDSPFYDRYEQRWQWHTASLTANRYLVKARLGRISSVPPDLVASAKAQIEAMQADKENRFKADRAALAAHALAVVRQQAGDPEGALSEAEFALKVRKELADYAPENAEWQRNLAQTALLVARLYGARTATNSAALPRALEHYKLAIDRLKALGKLHRQGGEAGLDVPTARMLAGAERSLGDFLFARRDWQGAIDAFQNAASRSRALLRVAGGNVVWREDLARSLDGLAKAELKSGALEKAEASFAEAHDNRRLWLEHDPADARRVETFVNRTMSMSDWLAANGQPADADRIRRNARAVLTQLKDDRKLSEETWSRSLDVLSH